jgi:hypothetical protein
MHTPYLIQRGEIKRPLVEGRLSEAVNLDYMGSAEFEFGALPKSLRALQSMVDAISLTTEPRTAEGSAAREGTASKWGLHLSPLHVGPLKPICQEVLRTLFNPS